MEPISHIRKTIFLHSQAEFAALVGVSQATVSRWESGQLQPTLTEMVRIREGALARGIAWDDRLFFETPPPVFNTTRDPAGSVSTASDPAAFSSIPEAAE